LTAAVQTAIGLFLASVGFMPNGVELKAERRKPSGEKHCDIEVSVPAPDRLFLSAGLACR
jgi:hypothetical protein